jgi:hypothetical protein
MAGTATLSRWPCKATALRKSVTSSIVLAAPSIVSWNASRSDCNACRKRALNPGESLAAGDRIRSSQNQKRRIANSTRQMAAPRPYWHRNARPLELGQLAQGGEREDGSVRRVRQHRTWRRHEQARVLGQAASRERGGEIHGRERAGQMEAVAAGPSLNFVATASRRLVHQAKRQKRIPQVRQRYGKIKSAIKKNSSHLRRVDGRVF